MASLIRLKQIESGSALQVSAEVGSDFSQSVVNIVSGSIVGVLPDGLISSSAQVDLISASGYAQLATDVELSVVSGAVATTIDILEASFTTTASFNSYTQSNNTSVQTLSSSIDSRFIGIESVTASFKSFSSSIDTTILNKMNVVGVISSSTQLTGATLKGITIAPVDSDSYSLIVSGALAIVGATGLQNGVFGDSDSTVPAQLYLDGNAATASTLPPDPSTNNQANSNMVDMGEF